MNTWGFEDDEFSSDIYDNFDVADLYKSFNLPMGQSLGRTSRRALGTLDPNALPRRQSLTQAKKLASEDAPAPARLALEVERSDCADRGPPRSHVDDGLLRESLLCTENIDFEEPLSASGTKVEPPVQAIEALSPHAELAGFPEPALSTAGCTEEALQFLYTGVPPPCVESPTVTASWYGSKGNCRGWEMLNFQEEARIGRRKLLVLQSDTPVSLSVLIMRDTVPLHDLGSSELHLERVKVEKHVSDCMGSGIPAEKNLANCSLGLEVQLGPEETEARILLHCERLGKDRRRDAYTVMVLDNNRRGAVVCSWNCHVYNLKYESMNKKSRFVPTPTGAAPVRYQLRGHLWTKEEDCGLAGDLAP